MRRFIILTALSPALLLGCSGDARATSEAAQLAKYDLSEAQLQVAKAFIRGKKKELRTAFLPEDTFESIACYAKSQRVPKHLSEAHLLYLSNFTEVDKNFYAYFAPYRISDVDAHEMSEMFLQHWLTCGPIEANNDTQFSSPAELGLRMRHTN